MNNNSSAGLPYEVVATQSLMCQWLSLNEVRKIKEMVKRDKWLNHLHKFKHGLWLTENGLTQRQTLLFQFQCRYEDSAKKDIAIINRLLG